MKIYIVLPFNRNELIFARIRKVSCIKPQVVLGYMKLILELTT